MSSSESRFLLDVWSYDKDGVQIHPYRGERGQKKGLFSVNFTNDTKKFEALTEEELVEAILNGRFKGRGTIRMLPVNAKPGAERNAFGPLFYKGRRVKDFGV
ncbi:hypothetical protein D9M70_531910 [compost metagenome]